MAPSRKSRSVNKRFGSTIEASSSKYVEDVNKSKQKKRKFSDMLGPQWSKDELGHFYEAYRKYGKDWKKVAAAVRTRSMEMVEALFTMNRAYLSLPEGTASVVGLIAMMTDHYSVLGGSDSEQESNEGLGATRKPQKRLRGKSRNNNSKGLEAHLGDVTQSQSLPSSYGCLSLLKKRRSGIKPHAVGKRTPRVPVSYSFDKDIREKYFSPSRHNSKPKVDQNDDDVAHEIALVLTEASQRDGSPQLSQTPNQKVEGHVLSPMRNSERMRSESDKMSTKFRCSEMDDGGCELSLGSTGADNADYDKGKNTREIQRKSKRYYGKKLEVEESTYSHLDDIKEACSGTEEGQKSGSVRGKFEGEDMDVKSVRSSFKGPRKRSKKALFGGDECSTFDALQTLADLSLMMPETTADTEPSAKVKEENLDFMDKPKMKGNLSIAGAEISAFKASKPGKAFSNSISPIVEADGVQGSNIGNRKRKQKSSSFKISAKDDDNNDSRLSDTPKTKAADEVKSSFGVGKGKRSPHNAGPAKASKTSKPPDHSSSSTDHKREDADYALSTTQLPSTNLIYLPTKVRSRRKMDLRNSQRESKIGDDISIDQLKIAAQSSDDRLLDLKQQHSNCLSWCKLRRWCVFEWFYSAIDYPWFAKCEFVEYLNHVGLGHIPRLTRVEWGVIRSSLGRPRRFSAQFLQEEKQKLNQYRESVRKHYAELRAGTREGLPTDLARPLSVGQRVIAIHPKTREIHDGSVLTVDYSRCRVQFDRTELGVEFVSDIECMPLNPVENMPANLSRHGMTLDKIFGNLSEVKINGLLKEGKIEDYMKSSSHDKLESTDGSVFISPATHHINKLIKQAKVDLACSNLPAKFGFSENVSIQQEASSQPSALSQIQAKEADVHALAELSRVLDKKEVVVTELKRLNDEVLENQKNGDNLLKDSENFKKQYAAVLLQLNEVNEQVSSALFSLRQRNTYQGTSPLMFLKPVHDLGGDSGCHAQEPGSHVAEIVGSSRGKAQTMIDEAMQAMFTLRKGESKLESIEDSIDFVSNRLSVDDLALPSVKSTAADTNNAATVSQNHLNVCTSSPLAANHVVDLKSNGLSDKNEAEIPSELIAHCVATLLMIQKCTERQFPPSDVAQVLDSAINSLQPSCPQNLPLYAEIQKCMGIIRSQILALIPT